MSAEIHYLDVSDSPELARLAADVQASRGVTVLVRGEQRLAVLSPWPEAAAAHQPSRARPRRRDRKSILNLVGIADEYLPADSPTDVSANVHGYVAQAYQPRSAGWSERC
jgi:hypothetical protein